MLYIVGPQRAVALPRVRCAATKAAAADCRCAVGLDRCATHAMQSAAPAWQNDFLHRTRVFHRFRGGNLQRLATL